MGSSITKSSYSKLEGLQRHWPKCFPQDNCSPECSEEEGEHTHTPPAQGPGLAVQPTQCQQICGSEIQLFNTTIISFSQKTSLQTNPPQRLVTRKVSACNVVILVTHKKTRKGIAWFEVFSTCSSCWLDWYSTWHFWKQDQSFHSRKGFLYPSL